MHRWIGAASLAVALAGGAGTAGAQNAFHEPPVFASQNGTLNILMNLKQKPIPTITFTSPTTGKKINPAGWASEICQRTWNGQTSCPSGSGTVWDYGGTRLALTQGDDLKIHFTNLLPPFDPNKLLHAQDEPNDVLNPTNLHTHGLLTPARAASRQNPTWGDDIFVQVFNPANGTPNPQFSPHNMGDVVVGPIDYNIPVVNNMPSSLLWYHAHVHGIALEQLSHGMAGILTIGNIGDNVTGDINTTRWPNANVRHLMLKDIQVMAANPAIDFNGGAGPVAVADGEVYAHTFSGFCNQFPLPGDAPRNGSCPGVSGAPGANDFTGGVWYFTINGVKYPTIPIAEPDGEIWRISNGAGSLSWDLQLVNDQTGKQMTVQLVAIDGIAVTLPQDTPMSSMVSMAGGKFHVVPCPNVTVITTVPVCVDEWVMMPSSRVDMFVTYRNGNGVIVPPPTGATATFTMVGLTMGSGDTWPSVNMAKVLFNQAGQRQFTTNSVVTSNSGLMQPGGLFVSANPTATAAPLPSGCAPLAPGHHRRIFFGFQDTAINNTFALAYEEVDQNGNVVPGTHYPPTDVDENNAAANPPGFPTTTGLAEFDPNVTVICLPLAQGQIPATETWELVQLSTENHNFHLHQTRFIEKVGPDAGNVIQDNFPLGVAVPNAAIAAQVANNQSGVCTIPQWRNGTCTSTAVVEQIPFTQLGEFVYHCHILEHEDGGMMARIVVVPSPN
jgi:FtsP/CotA-like multicopper oxidase with cupredoxin domain